jgi:signal peptidase II
MGRRRADPALFWGLVSVAVALDVVTKWGAGEHLTVHLPRAVFGSWVQLTLVYNPGAAFGIEVGPYSRWIFLVLTLLALAILGRLYWSTRPQDRLRTVALGLVCGGAIGNLIDRVRHEHGVVDFLDVGIGAWRWPTFNIADVAVSAGAFLLAWALWGEEEEGAEAVAPVPVPTTRPAERGLTEA